MVSAKEGKLFETNSKISAEESKLFEMNSKISAEESKPFDLKSTIPITDGFNGIGMGGGEGKISCAECEENTTTHFVPVICCHCCVVCFWFYCHSYSLILYVVQLEEVKVHSGEEDENVLYTACSTLFTYGETMLNKGTGI
jgi:hypothetical protein